MKQTRQIGQFNFSCFWHKHTHARTRYPACVNSGAIWQAHYKRACTHTARVHDHINSANDRFNSQLTPVTNTPTDRAMNQKPENNVGVRRKQVSICFPAEALCGLTDGEKGTCLPWKTSRRLHSWLMFLRAHSLIRDDAERHSPAFAAPCLGVGGAGSRT